MAFIWIWLHGTHTEFTVSADTPWRVYVSAETVNSALRSIDIFSFRSIILEEFLESRQYLRRPQAHNVTGSVIKWVTFDWLSGGYRFSATVVGHLSVSILATRRDIRPCGVGRGTRLAMQNADTPTAISVDDRRRETPQLTYSLQMSPSSIATSWFEFH